MFSSLWSNLSPIWSLYNLYTIFALMGEKIPGRKDVVCYMRKEDKVMFYLCVLWILKDLDQNLVGQLTNMRKEGQVTLISLDS